MSNQNMEIQKLFDEIQQKVAFSRQQLAIVKNQQTSKQRELRMSQLTISEIDSLPLDANVYEGVGKMFMAMPLDSVKTRLGKETDDIKKELSNLEKKATYLDTTLKNSNEHVERILKGGGR